MRQFLLFVLFSLLVSVLKAQSITLEPQTSGKRFSMKSTGDYGYFSTNYLGNAYLKFLRNEPVSGTGNTGNVVGEIYTTSLNHFLIGTPLANNTGSFFLQTMNTPRIVITPSGNVGIGTFNPQRRLHLYYGASGVTFSANSSAILESNTSHYLTLATPENAESGVLFSKAASGDASGGIIYGTNNALNFRTNGNIDRLTVTNSGNVGVGTVNPQARLSVTSNQANLLQVNHDVTEQFGVRSNGLYMRKVFDGSSLVYVTNSQTTSNVQWGYDNTGTEMKMTDGQNIAHGVASKLMFNSMIFEQSNKSPNPEDPSLHIFDPDNNEFNVYNKGIYLVDMTVQWDNWSDQVRRGRIEVRVNNEVRRSFNTAKYFREHCFISCNYPDRISIWVYHEECSDPACLVTRSRAVLDARVTVMKY